jgi:hypothetical protein
MSLYGVGLEIEVKRIQTQFKLFLQKRQGVAIRTLESIFKRSDKSGNGKLNQQEFEGALNEFG